MPRRRSSAFEDLLSFAAWLPWKLSMGLAFASFIGLHLLALAFGRPVTSANTADLGNVAIRGYLHVFAFCGQYIVPFGFLLGAAVSLVKRRRSITLIGDAREGRDIVAMTWQQFEQLVEEGFRQRGFQVAARGGASPDGGVDLELKRAGARYLVQCKQWRARQVGVTIVRELCGVMTAEKAQGGYVVTSGQFTAEAKEFARRSRIDLIDGDELQNLLKVQPASPTPEATRVARTIERPLVPTCPGCGKPMVERTAKRGAMTGQSFWGCQDYPRCRRILQKDWSPS